MKKQVPVVSAHSHFNIFRNPHDAHEGDITVEEQIKAVDRFIRWHKRQVEVGNKMMAQLVKHVQHMEELQPVTVEQEIAEPGIV